MFKLRLYACCLLWAVVSFAVPAEAKFCAGLPCGEVAIRDECALGSGDPQACATAPIVRTLAELETCWEANRRMCIVDGELVANATVADPTGLTITYTAVKQDTTIYFTTGGEKPSCVVWDNSTGAEITGAITDGIYVLPDLALAESHTTIINLCVKERRAGVDIGHTVAVSGTATAGAGDTVTDSGGGFGAASEFVKDIIVLRRGDADEEIREIKSHTDTAVTARDAWTTIAAAGDTYEVWDSDLFEAFHYKHSDTNVKHFVTLIKPKVTVHSPSNSSFGIGQNAQGCTSWVIEDAEIQAPIGIDAKGTCTGLAGTADTTSAISAVNDTFDFGSAHPFATGDVVESAEANNGLAIENPYYVIDVDTDTIALAYTKHDAIGLTWSSSVTWDVDLTGAHDAKIITPIEQASYTIRGGLWTSTRETQTPRMAKVTGNVIVRIEDAVIRHGTVATDSDSNAYLKVIIRDTLFDLPSTHVITTADGGRTELFCRGMKLSGWGPARGSGHTSDIFSLSGNPWADCELELVDGDVEASQSVLDAGLSGWDGDGGRFLRFIVTTPAGVEFADTTAFDLIRTATPTGARGALIGRGGSSLTNVIIDGAYNTTSQTYPVTDPNNWCTHDGTIVDGDTCCVHKQGLPCETVLGLDVPHASNFSFNVCGEATTVNNNTVYYGPGGADGSEIDLVENVINGQTCDINAAGSTTEADEDEKVYTSSAFYVTSMTCRNEQDANADITFTLRTAAGALSPAVACTISDGERDCVGETTHRVALVASGATMAVAVSSTSDVGDNNGFVCEVHGHPKPAVGLNSCEVDQRSGNSFLAKCYSPIDGLGSY